MNSRDYSAQINRPQRMDARKFAGWIFMVSIVMIFAALTSAYIVRQAEGDWDLFELPKLFLASTIVILASSATMHWAVVSARRNQLETIKLALGITLLLGFAFLIMQWYGWLELVNIKVFLVGNPSGSFVYIISGLHGLHIVGALVYVLVVLWSAYQYRIHSKNMSRLEMCAVFWHFLDGLWVYLYLFLSFYR
jgi:cytochrome c oxidase subunit 3